MTEVVRYAWWCGTLGEATDGAGPVCGTVDGAPNYYEGDDGAYIVGNAIIWCSVCGRVAPQEEGCRWVESASLPV
jgi:hypothetical protein